MSKKLGSVLLVDDDPHTCNIFQMVMEHFNLDFTIVNDADAAFLALKTSIPDVIVLDIFLPGTDGYQIFNRIRQQSLAIRWILMAVREKKGRASHEKLADELMAAYKREGAAVSRRDNVHRMADANKAFAHFAW